MTTVKSFWQQNSPLVSALRAWIEQDLHRSVDAVVRIEPIDEILDFADPITVCFADATFEVCWKSGKLVKHE